MPLPFYLRFVGVRLLWIVCAGLALRAGGALAVALGAFPPSRSGDPLGVPYLVDALGSAALAFGVYRLSLKFAGLGMPAGYLADVSALRTIYDAANLASRPTRSLDGNSYTRASDRDLAEVAHHIDREKAGARYEQWLDAVKARVERAYLRDGRLIPSALLATKPQLAPEGSTCGQHPERSAGVACLRCGSFACDTCAELDGKHCGPCLDVLIPRS